MAAASMAKVLPFLVPPLLLSRKALNITRK
jgi:hypothetical protein